MALVGGQYVVSIVSSSYSSRPMDTLKWYPRDSLRRGQDAGAGRT